MIDGIKKDIERLVKEECYEDIKKCGMFHSTHEGYATILEELEEAKQELADMDGYLSYLWTCIKTGKPGTGEIAREMLEKAILLCQEAIEMAAMIQKYKESIFGDVKACKL